MKSRLAASILLSAGKCWVNTRSKVQSRSISAVFDRRHGQNECSFHARRIEGSIRAVHSSALEDDDFSELGPGVSECPPKKIELVTEKHDDFVDDDVSFELDPGLSDWSDQEIELVTKKSHSFLDDDAFSELGPGTSETYAKKLKLVTEKRDHFPRNYSQKRESTRMRLSSDYKALVSVIAKSSTTASTKPRAPINVPVPTDNNESGSKSLSSDCRPNGKEGFGAVAKSSTTSSTKSRSPIHVPVPTANNESGGKSLSSDCRPNGKEGFGAVAKSSTTSSTKSRSPDQAPTSTDDNRKISETKHPLSVSVKNIPCKVGLPELVEAISVFGKVSGASFVTTSDKLKCCDIEFEDADSSRRAVLAGKVEVGSLVFQVKPLDAVDLVTVRIDNISVRTTDSAVHSICKSAGELVGLSRTSQNRVDAFFNVQNRTRHLDVVKKLNDTVCDLNHWSARELTSISNSSDARYKVHSHIYDQCSKLSTELAMKRVYLQDLETLNACIMHLHDISPASSQLG